MDDIPRVKLKRLKIDRYRTIRPGTELHFSDGITVLLGKNGTGKTTLLNLLAMVLRGNFHEAREEEFAVEYDFAYVSRPSTWSIKIANELRPSQKKAEVPQSAALIESFQLSYRANGDNGTSDFTILSTDGVFEVATPEKIINKKVPLHGLFASPFNETAENFINSILTNIDNIIGMSPTVENKFPYSIYRLDEARDWLHEVLRKDLVSIIFKRSGNLGGRSGENFPDDMIGPLTSAFRNNREGVSLVADSVEIPSLQRIVSALGYTKGRVVLEQFSADKSWIFFGNPRFHFTKHDGTVVRLEQLSFGEQRLFAFYYYLACTSDVVVADELTNGLHHEMISGCIAAIGGRQAFLATQNPLLLDHLQFSSIDEVRGAFVLCGKETSDGQEWMAMRQLAEAEGREFFGHYQVELKQVNAILRWLGLW